VNGDGAAAPGTCQSTSAAAPQPGDSGQGRPIHGTQALREGGGGGARGAALKGKCAFGPFLSILVIECQHKS
jgi:hypothetical protein